MTVNHKKLFSIFFVITLSLFQLSCESDPDDDSRVVDQGPEDEADQNLPSRPNDPARPAPDRDNPEQFDGFAFGGNVGETYDDNQFFNNIPQYCGGASSNDLELEGFDFLFHELQNRIGNVSVHFTPEAANAANIREDISCLCDDWEVSRLNYAPHKQIIYETYEKCDGQGSCPGINTLQVGQMKNVATCVSPLFAKVSFYNFDHVEHESPLEIEGFISHADVGNACQRFEASSNFWNAAESARDELYDAHYEQYLAELASCENTFRCNPDSIQAPNRDDEAYQLSRADYIYLAMSQPLEAGGIYQVEKQLRFDEDLEFGLQRLGGATVERLVSGCLAREGREVRYIEEVSVIGSRVDWFETGPDGGPRHSPIAGDPTNGEGTSVLEGGEEALNVLRALQQGGDPLHGIQSCMIEAITDIYKLTVDSWYESQPLTASYEEIGQGPDGELIRNKDNDGDGACNLIDWCDDRSFTGQQILSNSRLRAVHSSQGRFVDLRDADGDFVGDLCDLCLGNEEANLSLSEEGAPYQVQADEDFDGVGDSCDVCENANDQVADGDGDGVCLPLDNCPGLPNPFQLDPDGDGLGNVCDPCDNINNNDHPEAVLNNCELDNGDANRNDRDGDTVSDAEDNCPGVPNIQQRDHDEDRIGNVCDEDCVVYDENESCEMDADFDGIPNAEDNCVYTANEDQSDSDGDGEGDACDQDCADENEDGDCDEGDRDFDEVSDAADNCPDNFNPDQVNSDGDRLGDACDNCPEVNNHNQFDDDEDGIGNRCDEDCIDEDGDGRCDIGDRDGDGVRNDFDNCPREANPDQADEDGDGRGDVCDGQNDNDIDGDGILNEDDNCMRHPNPDQRDVNENGIGDDCDPQCFYDARGVRVCIQDQDRDGVADEIDNCPRTPNADQADRDNDGQGDICDGADPFCPDGENCLEASLLILHEKLIFSREALLENPRIRFNYMFLGLEAIPQVRLVQNNNVIFRQHLSSYNPESVAIELEETLILNANQIPEAGEYILELVSGEINRSIPVFIVDLNFESEDGREIQSLLSQTGKNPLSLKVKVIPASLRNESLEMSLREVSSEDGTPLENNLTRVEDSEGNLINANQLTLDNTGKTQSLYIKPVRGGRSRLEFLFNIEGSEDPITSNLDLYIKHFAIVKDKNNNACIPGNDCEAHQIDQDNPAEDYLMFATWVNSYEYFLNRERYDAPFTQVTLRNEEGFTVADSDQNRYYILFIDPLSAQEGLEEIQVTIYSKLPIEGAQTIDVDEESTLSLYRQEETNLYVSKSHIFTPPSLTNFNNGLYQAYTSIRQRDFERYNNGMTPQGFNVRNPFKMENAFKEFENCGDQTISEEGVQTIETRCSDDKFKIFHPIENRTIRDGEHNDRSTAAHMDGFVRFEYESISSSELLDPDHTLEDGLVNEKQLPLCQRNPDLRRVIPVRVFIPSEACFRTDINGDCIEFIDRNKFGLPNIYENRVSFEGTFGAVVDWRIPLYNAFNSLQQLCVKPLLVEEPIILSPGRIHPDTGRPYYFMNQWLSDAFFDHVTYADANLLERGIDRTDRTVNIFMHPSVIGEQINGRLVPALSGLSNSYEMELSHVLMNPNLNEAQRQEEINQIFSIRNGNRAPFLIIDASRENVLSHELLHFSALDEGHQNQVRDFDPRFSYESFPSPRGTWHFLGNSSYQVNLSRRYAPHIFDMVREPINLNGFPDGFEPDKYLRSYEEFDSPNLIPVDYFTEDYINLEAE